MFPQALRPIADLESATAFRNSPGKPAVIAITALFLSTLLITSCGLSTQTPNHLQIVSASKFKSPIVQTADRKNLLGLLVSGNLGQATVGDAYSAALSVGGGIQPYRFWIVGGTLPSGLGLNPGTGVISGTPLFSGTYPFAVVVTDAKEDRGFAWLNLTVAPSASSVSVQVSPTTANLASSDTQQFSATVRESGNASVVWSASPGTVSETGLFTAPTVTATTTATVVATSVADPSKKASAVVTVAPNSPAGPVITSTALPPAQSGAPYSATLAASGGKLPYKWSASSGLPSGLALNSASGAVTGTTTQTGTFPFTAKVTDASSQSNSTALSLSVASQITSGFDGPAELPRVYLHTTLADTPAPGTTLSVSAGGDFQAALNNANCGDTIQLQAGAVFPGTFTLPAKACDDQHWIIIRTDAADSSLPVEGTRLTPCYAGVASLPGRPSFNCSSTQKVLPQIVYPGRAGEGPIFFAPGANHYRLLGLEITRQTGTGGIGALVSAHKGTASHIVIDRVWLHGTAQEETQSGLHLSDTTYVAVVDSFFSDFHCISRTGACTDGKSIGGGTGSNPGGPYKIVNNFLEGSGQSVMFGGGPATTTPTDIEIRRNHLFKPLLWMPGEPGFVGGASGDPFIVKNHFELKNAQRVLFEGNILENSWGGFSQVGYSILLTPKNQHTNAGPNVCPICQVTDITIRYNTISHVGSGLGFATSISGHRIDGGMALAGARYSIHDVTVDDLSASRYKGSGTLIQVSNSWTAHVLNSVTINHITGLTDPNGHVLVLGNNTSNPSMWGFNFTNNIVVAGRYPVWNSDGGTSSCAYHDVPVLSLATCFTSYTFSDNAVIGSPSAFPPSRWSPGNYFPAQASDAQFVNYNNGNGGDYHLLPSSQYKNVGSDGKDLGADIDAIRAATAGVK